MTKMNLSDSRGQVRGIGGLLRIHVHFATITVMSSACS
jgi:hypothetical protein